MKNILVFDASTTNIFICGAVDGKSFLSIRNYEKSKMSVDMPADFKELGNKFANSDLPRVIIGSGPGSFTGLKTGLSFFLALIYSKGIKKVEKISSSRLMLNLFKGNPETLKAVIIPFNNGEFFLSVYDKNKIPLFEDVFLKVPFDNLAQKIQSVAGSDIEIIVPIKCPDDLISVLSRHFNITGIFSDKFMFEPESFDKMQDLQIVDISTEPMILNYVTYPANIEGTDNLYVKN